MLSYRYIYWFKGTADSNFTSCMKLPIWSMYHIINACKIHYIHICIIHLFVIFRSCFVIEFIFFLLYIFVRYWYEIFGLSLVMCELADTYMLYYSFCVSYMLVLDSHWSERMYTQLLHCKFISFGYTIIYAGCLELSEVV